MATELISPPPSPQTRWPGLVASVGGDAAIRAATQGDKWLNGVEWLPEWCDLNDQDPIPAVECDTTGINVSAGNPSYPDMVEESAFAYWEVSRCSTFGSTVEERTRIAERRLGETISHKLERELWTGGSHIAYAKTGQYLTDGVADTVNDGTATPLPYALAHLQNAWGVCAQGRRGMIHCTPATATLWMSAGVVRREAGFLLDTMDNVVIAGSGYDGSGPDHEVDGTGETAWAYMTNFVSVRWTPVEVIDREPSRIDRVNNIDTAIAWRAALTAYDPCCSQAVLVDLCTPCCTPVS